MTFGSRHTRRDDGDESEDGERGSAQDATTLTRRRLLAAAATAGVAGRTPVDSAAAVPDESPETAGSAVTGSRGARGGPAIRAPNRTAVGEPLRIRLAGFDPGATVTVTASATDARGVDFSSSWSLRTDADGAATVAEADAAPGRDPTRTTTGVSRTPGLRTAMGPGFDDAESAGFETLLHRLEPADGSPTPAHFVVGDRATVDVRLTASAGGERRAAATTTRVYVAPGVSRRTVDADGLAGWLYLPPDEAPRPGILALHGSHAIIPHRLSRVLASHGYATLALQYFGGDLGVDGLPDSVDDVPVEYFRRATRWLTGRDDVLADAVGFVGISRGVEAALLAGVEFSGRTAVVGFSGGGVLAPGANRSATAIEGWESAWTRDGEPVAAADAVRPVFTAVESVARGECEAADCAPGAVRRRVPSSALRRAVAPVEEVDGPVLLLAGTNDFAWHAPELSALAIDRLDRSEYDHPYQLRVYDGAGHVFGLPYQSYAGEATGPQYGGSPAANAFGAADSWPLVLRYLRAGTSGDGDPGESRPVGAL